MLSLRYVVLHHEGFDEPHYDLMIESDAGGALITWHAPRWPIFIGDELTRLPDHRRDYLDYEGPVSNNRGMVRREVSGTCTFAIAPSFPPQFWIELFTPQPTAILLRNVVNAGDAHDRWQVTKRWTVIEVKT